MAAAIPKIVCIGAAVQDVFLKGKIFTPQKEDNEMVEEFKLGSKNDVEEVIFSTGGGATNAAVTFARQGFHVCYMGKVGKDVAGTAVIDALHEEQIDTSLVMRSKELGTGYSVLLLAPNGERTILTYRGASAHYELHRSDFHSVDADWFYISSHEGNFDSIKTILDYAMQNDIKVAINPGKKELEDPKKMHSLLQYIELISLNKDEAKMLFKGDSLAELLDDARQYVKYVLITDGPKGEIATDGIKIVTGGLYEDVPVIDRTGAGDAFSSGFVAMVARGEPIENALLFASANSTSVVGKIGAKAGILDEHVRLHYIPLKIEDVSGEE